MAEFDSGLDIKRVREQFNAAASSYDQHAVMQKEVGRRLDERFDYLKLEPARVLDLGCGTGQMLALMKQRYRNATLVGMDLAEAMLCQQQTGFLSRLFSRSSTQHLCADMHALPFVAGCFDVVVSNLALQWSVTPDHVFLGVQRALARGGVFMFSTLGPDSLIELRQAWREVDPAPHVHAFVDMHDLGDALVRAGFADPVMDVERLTLTYANLRDLLRDIKGVGAGNALIDRRKGLLARSRFKRLEEVYESFRTDQGLPLTYEVVYGHAWGAGPVQRRAKDAVTIPLEALKLHKKL